MPQSTESPMDIDERIDSSGCGADYRLLEECIVEAERDWRKCQHQVIALRRCMALRGSSQTETEPPLERKRT